MGRPVDARDTVIELERRAFEARVDVTGLRRELDAAFAEADRRSAELEAIDAAGSSRTLRLAVLSFLWMLPLALCVLGAAS